MCKRIGLIEDKWSICSIRGAILIKLGLVPTTLIIFMDSKFGDYQAKKLLNAMKIMVEVALETLFFIAVYVLQARLF